MFSQMLEANEPRSEYVRTSERSFPSYDGKGQNKTTSYRNHATGETVDVTQRADGSASTDYNHPGGVSERMDHADMDKAKLHLMAQHGMRHDS